MVKSNRIKHLDGNGAELNEIANPPFLKVVSTARRFAGVNLWGEGSSHTWGAAFVTRELFVAAG